MVGDFLDVSSVDHPYRNMASARHSSARAAAWAKLKIYGYNFRSAFPRDALGGSMVGLVCLSQTLAHSSVAGTQSLQGPYCALVPPLVYMLLGASPHTSISSGALVSMLLADGLLSWPGLADRTELASLTAFLAGAFLAFFGSCRLSFVVQAISRPVLCAFSSACAILIMAQQAPNLLGFHRGSRASGGGLAAYVASVSMKLEQVDMMSFFLGTFQLGILTGLGRLEAHALWELKRNNGDPRASVLKCLAQLREVIVIAGGIAFGYFTASPGGQACVTTVGMVHAGLPPPRLPWDVPALAAVTASADDFGAFVLHAALIAIVSFVTTFATTRRAAEHFRCPLNSNKEMVALGVAGACGAFFGAFPPSGSLSRANLANNCGIQTRLGNLFSVAVVSLSLMFLTPALRFLPTCVLAAILLNICRSLIDFELPAELWASWKPHRVGGLRRDLVAWVLTFVSTLALGALRGFLLALVLSVFCIVKDAAAPPIVALGRLETPTGERWCSLLDCRQARSSEEILILEVRGPLNFASAEWFHAETERARSRWERTPRGGLKVVVISLICVNDFDLTAVKVLEQLLLEWRARGVSCVVSGVRRQVRFLLEERLVQRRRPRALLTQQDLQIGLSEAVRLARQRLGLSEFPVEACSREEE